MHQRVFVLQCVWLAWKFANKFKNNNSCAQGFCPATKTTPKNSRYFVVCTIKQIWCKFGRKKKILHKVHTPTHHEHVKYAVIVKKKTFCSMRCKKSWYVHHIWFLLLHNLFRKDRIKGLHDLTLYFSCGWKLENFFYFLCR